MMLAEMLGAVLVQVALTFALMLAMGAARVNAVRRGEVKIRDIALGQSGWPVKATQVERCYSNQFQLPVLFYVLAILCLLLRKADLVMVVLAWLFVALRLAHAWVHVGSNHVPTRFRIFAAGALVLLAMWVIFATRILLEV